ncbi:MAG: hypothetical protein KBT02_12425 [Treponema sp.]|nr:hypothetical protein [Candidatus Treponema caballi]
MKKCIAFICVLLTMSFLIAEPASTNLTDSDVQNFAKNYARIVDNLEDASSESDVDSILQKYGISGPDRVQKYSALTLGMIAVSAESQMDPQTVSLFKSMGVNPVAAYTARINSADYAVMEKYSSQLVAAFEAYQNGEEYDDSYDEPASQPAAQTARASAGRSSASSPAGEGSAYLRTARQKITSASKTGDCGLLYQKYDAVNASKYAKTTVPSPSFVAHKAWYSGNEQEALLSVSSSMIELTYYPEGSDDQTTDVIRLTVSSKDFYMLKKTAKSNFYDDGVSGEYILKTKEAGTIHIWYSSSVNGKPQTVKVWIEGLGELDFSDFVFRMG